MYQKAGKDMGTKRCDETSKTEDDGGLSKVPMSVSFGFDPFADDPMKDKSSFEVGLKDKVG